MIKLAPASPVEACRDEESTRVGVGIRQGHPAALGVLVDLRGRLRAAADDHDLRQGKQDRHEEQCVTDRLHAIMPNVSAEDRRACEPYPPALGWPSVLN
jgi:hypothetical protein